MNHLSVLFLVFSCIILVSQEKYDERLVCALVRIKKKFEIPVTR